MLELSMLILFSTNANTVHNIVHEITLYLLDFHQYHFLMSGSSLQCIHNMFHLSSGVSDIYKIHEVQTL